MTKKVKSFGFFSSLAIVLIPLLGVGCSNSYFGGNDPAAAGSSSSAPAPDAANSTGTATAAPGVPAAEKPLEVSAPIGTTAPGSGSPTTTTVTQTTASGPTTVPAASPGDLTILQQCLAQWGAQSPFSGTITNYKKLVAETSYGAFGNVIDDTTVSAAPELILVVAADNVGGVPTYQLMNPNGYYCFESGSSTGSVLTIDLACGAHVAGPGVQEDVGAVGSAAGATISGANTGAVINLNYVSVNGSACPAGH